MSEGPHVAGGPGEAVRGSHHFHVSRATAQRVTIAWDVTKDGGDQVWIVQEFRKFVFYTVFHAEVFIEN